MRLYPHLVAAVYDRPWAILPTTMDIIVEVMSLRKNGERFSEDEIMSRLAAAKEEQGPRQGTKQEIGVSVIPIYGTIHPKMNLMSEMSGGTSVEAIRKNFRAALADDKINAIVFDIDSPGGAVDGLPELADEIYEARGQKPMVAVANTLMASAAYWLGSQADMVVASPSSAVGSIGVVAVHEDHSGRLEKAGVKPTFITSAPYKAEGNHAQALTKDAQDYVQGQVDYFGMMFHEAVARGRGIEIKSVAKDYGKGRVLNVQQATDVGMVDEVNTLEGAIGEIALSAATQIDGVVSSTMVAVGELGSESFGDRLARVAGEVETLAAHAKARREMRRDDGRDLSPTTLGQFRRMVEALEPLVQAGEPQQEPKTLSSAAGIMVPHLMTRIRQLEATR
jgi:signal peptide peptidase SppA